MTKTKLVFFGSFNKSMFGHLHTNKALPHPSLQEDWIKYRFDIWQKYTWNSIQRQYCDEWQYVLCCHADTKDLINKYFKDIRDPRLIISYTDGEKEVIDGLAHGCDNVIMCRIDSDDMYDPSVSDVILSDTDNPEWGYFPVGYALDLQWLDLYEWNCHGSGPFFYHRYTAKDFAQRDKIEEPPHRWVMKNNPKKLPAGKFMVTLHKKNTSSGMHCGNLTRRIVGDKEWELYKRFKIRL